MRPRLRNRGPDLRGSGAVDRKREHRVEEEARDRDGGDDEHERDYNRAPQRRDRLAVQHMSLEVIHRKPDPHRGRDLHEREPPSS